MVIIVEVEEDECLSSCSSPGQQERHYEEVASEDLFAKLFGPTRRYSRSRGKVAWHLANQLTTRPKYGLDTGFRSNGKTITTIDEITGKIIHFVSSKDLWIPWADYSQYYEWYPDPNRLFPQVTRIKSVCWVEINAYIVPSILSQRTAYESFLICKADSVTSNLWNYKQYTTVNVEEADCSEEIQLDPDELTPYARGKDGWSEIPLGEFYIKRGDGGTVHVRWMSMEQGTWKNGISVLGIELRPKKNTSWPLTPLLPICGRGQTRKIRPVS